MPIPEHMKTGYRGEQLAARFLTSNGYKILSANYKTYVGEMDIIAMDKNKLLCFVEVKTRSPGGLFPPADAVDLGKQQRLLSVARTYIKQSGVEFSKVRFDIIEVILKDLFNADINHIKDAFGQGEFSDP